MAKRMSPHLSKEARTHWMQDTLKSNWDLNVKDLYSIQSKIVFSMVKQGSIGVSSCCSQLVPWPR